MDGNEFHTCECAGETEYLSGYAQLALILSKILTVVLN